VQKFTVTLAEDTKYSQATQTASVSVAKAASTVAVEFSTDGVIWGSTISTPRPFGSSLFIRPVVAGSTGSISLTAWPSINLIDTTSCVGRSGICRGEFKFTNTSTATQTFKFAVASDQNYNAAEVSGSIALEPKPTTSISIEYSVGGPWVPASTITQLPQGSELGVRAVVAGSGGAVTLTSNPTNNLTDVYQCSKAAGVTRSGVCSALYTLNSGTSQKITFQVAGDSSFDGATANSTVTIQY
jgi:hypothetical protein